MASEGSLVDLAFLVSGEGKAVGLKLIDGIRCLLAHIVDSILIPEPVTSLDCVVGVPAPVVVMHVAEGSIDASLGSYSVGAGGEEFRDAGSLEALLDQSESSP